MLIAGGTNTVSQRYNQLNEEDSVLQADSSYQASAIQHQAIVEENNGVNGVGIGSTIAVAATTSAVVNTVSNNNAPIPHNPDLKP